MMTEIQLKERLAELKGARQEVRAIFQWLSQDYQTNKDDLMIRFKTLNALISEVKLILNEGSVAASSDPDDFGDPNNWA